MYSALNLELGKKEWIVSANVEAGMHFPIKINFLVLLAILVYVFALLGMKMFAGHFKFDEEGKFDKENGIVPR